MEEVSQIGNRNDHYKGWQVRHVHQLNIFILNSLSQTVCIYKINLSFWLNNSGFHSYVWFWENLKNLMIHESN